MNNHRGFFLFRRREFINADTGAAENIRARAPLPWGKIVQLTLPETSEYSGSFKNG